MCQSPHIAFLKASIQEQVINDLESACYEKGSAQEDRRCEEYPT